MDNKKQCTKCGEWKPATTEFWHKYKAGKYGLQSRCKVCRAERRKEYYENNRERYAEYRKNNREYYAERQKEYQQRPDVQKRRSEYDKEYRQRPDVKERMRIHRLNYLARKNALPNTFTPEQWQECLSYFDHSCAVCGEPQNLFIKLEADHWIPLFNDDCTGTVVSNMIPLCGGSKFDSHTGCNQSKGNKDALDWLTEQYDTRKAQQIYDRIMDYFAWVESQN